MSMKVANSDTGSEHWLKPAEFTLSGGIIGFPEARTMELIYNPEETPFMWLRCAEDHALNFIVIEPQACFPDYAPEISDEDAERLEIVGTDDALVLCIVNFKPDEPEQATANLIGPILINRRTLEARQVVVSNFGDYSARQPLLAPESVGAADA